MAARLRNYTWTCYYMQHLGEQLSPSRQHSLCIPHCNSTGICSTLRWSKAQDNPPAGYWTSAGCPTRLSVLAEFYLQQKCTTTPDTSSRKYLIRCKCHTENVTIRIFFYNRESLQIGQAMIDSSLGEQQLLCGNRAGYYSQQVAAWWCGVNVDCNYMTHFSILSFTSVTEG